MPHLIVEYSANLESHIDVDALVQALHATAATIDALPLAGLRTRAHPCAQFAIADKHPDNGFIAVYLRIGEGRTLEQRRLIGETLRDALNAAVAQHYDNYPLALSLEIQEIQTDTRWNTNNLREYLAERKR